jgi:hypothetical protein
MEKITVERDGDRNITFTGELIATASSSDDRAMGSSYSGSTGRWQVLRLYKSKSGQFVAQRINRTRWQGERDTYEAAVCSSHEEIIEFFGSGWLAKDLLEEAGIDAAVDLDSDFWSRKIDEPLFLEVGADGLDGLISPDSDKEGQS